MLRSVLTGGVAAAAIMAGVMASQAQERITYLLHSTTNNVFWQAVKLGMELMPDLTDRFPSTVRFSRAR